MEKVRDEIKWNLGVEWANGGRSITDPSLTSEGFLEVEMRFADWLINGGGKWMSERPEVSKFRQ